MLMISELPRTTGPFDFILRQVQTRGSNFNGPDLTMRQIGFLQLLSHFRDDESERTTRQLAWSLNVQKPVISRAVNALEKIGFVRRVQDSKDKRNIFVEILPTGMAYIAVEVVE